MKSHQEHESYSGWAIHSMPGHGLLSSSKREQLEERRDHPYSESEVQEGAQLV